MTFTLAVLEEESPLLLAGKKFKLPASLVVKIDLLVAVQV